MTLDLLCSPLQMSQNIVSYVHFVYGINSGNTYTHYLHLNYPCNKHYLKFIILFVQTVLI